MRLDYYQRKYVDQLISRIQLDLDINQKSKQVFKAFTGAGKTVMLAKVIDELSDLGNFAFMWLTPAKGNLDMQSFISLKRTIPTFKVSMLSNFTDSKLDMNEVLVLNWELVNKKTNILMRESEKYSFKDILENTKSSGLNIVLIIDESHRNISADRSSMILKLIDPFITIEASATPSNTATVICLYNEGRKTGVVKKNAIINKDISSDQDQDEVEAVMEAALECYKRVAKEYGNLELGRPLMLVNIENSKGGEDGSEIKNVEEYLAKKGISVKNGNLGVWTSKRKDHCKTNQEKINLVQPDSAIEVLIFKQALTEGFDIPRACILVELRQSMGEVFKEQVAGRILRMLGRRHYDNYWIDNAFIFTNDSGFSIEQDEDGPIGYEIEAKLKPGISLELDSEYKQEDWSDIQVEDGLFKKIFWEEVGKYEFE